MTGARRAAGRKRRVTPAIERAAQKGRREMTEGKVISVGDLLQRALELDARKNGSRA